MHKLAQLLHIVECEAFNKGNSVCEQPLRIRGALTFRITLLTWTGVFMSSRLTVILVEDTTLC